MGCTLQDARELLAKIHRKGWVFPLCQSFLTSSNQRQLLDPPQCIVYAEHEILIFLYFERRWMNWR